MSKKSKIIVDEERKQYLERLEDLMQKINPKPCREEIERKKHELLEKRNIQ